MVRCEYCGRQYPIEFIENTLGGFRVCDLCAAVEDQKIDDYYREEEIERDQEIVSTFGTSF